MNPPISITVTLNLNRQFLADILTTAVEGGSNYWLMAKRIQRAPKGHVAFDYLSALVIVGPADVETREPFDAENFTPDAAGNRERDITLDTIADGIRRLLQPDPNLPDYARAKVHSAVVEAVVTNGVHGDYDAGDADVLVQLGYFGQVIYG